MKKIILLLIFAVLTINSMFALTYTLSLVDSCGDGWNGGSIDVLVNDVVVIEGATIVSGNSYTETFEVAGLDVITTVYTAGSWPTENEYQILNELNAVVAESGQGGGTPGNIEYTVPEVIAGTHDLALMVSPADGANNVATSGNLEWTIGENTDRINLILADNAEYTTPIIDDIITDVTTTQQAYSGLEMNTVYYWKLVAINTSGALQIENEGTFTTTIFSEDQVVLTGDYLTNTGLPIEPYYGYSLTQSIYLQSELNIVDQTITEITYVSNQNSSFTDNVVIYMGHTDSTAFNATSDWFNDGLTEVFNGDMVVSADNPLVTLELDMPFIYNNVDNLVVCIFETTSGYHSSSDEFYAFSIEDNRSLHYHADGTNPYALGFGNFPTGNLKSQLPVTAFPKSPFNNISIANNSNHVTLKPTISFEIIDNYQYYEVYFGLTPNPEDVIIPFSPVSNPVSYSFTDSLEYYTDYYWTVLLYDENYNASTLNFTFKTRPEMDGLGTEDQPYQIESLNDLITISDYPTLWDKHFIQTADIDASSTSDLNEGLGFCPIGNSSSKFIGSYNGQEHIISNLHINRPVINYVGLFGYTNGADISNLGLDNCNIEGDYSVGGLVGYQNSSSTINNSFSRGQVTGNSYVGGLVGYQYSSSIINNSYSSGQVTGDDYVGGLVGYQYKSSDINNSYSNVTVSGGYETGGLVGYKYNNTNTSNNSFWDIESSGQTSSAGGIGKTTAEMQNIYTYLDAGWDFLPEVANGDGDYWYIHPNYNGAYPFFANSHIDLPLYVLECSPFNEINNVTCSGTMSWPYDYLDNTSGYRISLGTDNPPTNVFNNQDLGLINNYDYTELDAYTSYYWQVIPYNENGDSEDCPIWSFTTGRSNMISVGSGDNTNTNLPIDYNYKKSYSQSIYLNSEMDISERDIEEISYYLTEESYFIGANQWEIYMGLTDKTEFADNEDWLLASQGLVQVANVTMSDSLEAGWFNIELTNPFAYDGTSNLIVGVLEYNAETSSDISNHFYTADTGHNRSLIFGHDTININPYFPFVGTLEQSIPKINFIYSEDVTTFSGLVKNSQGDYIAGANLLTADGIEVTSDVNGNFIFENPQITSYSITISAPWYEDQVVEFEVLEGQDNFLEVILLEELLPASNVFAVVNDDLSGVQLSWQAPQLARMESQLKASKSWQKTSSQGKASKSDLRTSGPAVVYNLYSYLGEEAENPENWTLVASNLTELTYEDTSFPTLELGDYYWAVEVVYSNNRLSEPVISNEVIKESLIETSLASQIDFGIVYLTNSSDYTSIEITNIGNGPLEISNITCDNLAFDLVYDSGDMLVGANATFIMEVNFTPEQVQTYNGTLLIENNSSNEPSLVIQLHGTGQYLPPANPENVQLTMSSNTAQISWDAVTEDIANNPITPDMYIVYFNGQNTSADEDFYFLATTTDLSYTHVNVGAFSDYMFYRVKAYVDVDNVVLARINQLTSQKRKVSQEEVEKIIIGNVRTNRAKK